MQKLTVLFLFMLQIQMVTKPCNRGYATCACAVTARAGGDVFTINHCHGHLTDFLSFKDDILKVYTYWSGYYKVSKHQLSTLRTYSTLCS